MDPIYNDFKIQVLSALTGTPIVQCCPCQDPKCQDPDCPMSVSDIDTQIYTDVEIVKPDHGDSYAPPFTYVFPTLPPTDTPNTISAFLNH